MYYILLLTLTGLFTLIAWRDMRHGIFLIAAALPAYLLRFDLFGLPMTMLEVMVLTVVILSLAKPGVRISCLGSLRRLAFPLRQGFVGQVGSAPQDDKRRWLLPIVVLLLAATIGIFVAPDHVAALGIWKAYFVEPILFFLVVIATIRDKTDLHKLFLALGAGALFVAVFAIFQYTTGLGIPEPWNAERRVTSIFPYPNAVGLYLGPLLILSAFQIFSCTKKSPYGSFLVRFFYGALALLGFVAIVFSKSEAAIVAVVATIFVASLFNKKLRRVTISVAMVATILVALIPSVRTPIFQKLTLQDYSGQVRIAQWRDAVEMIKDKPIFGAGLSGYPEVIKAYHSKPQNEIFQYPHNIILNIWTELGILGLIAVAWLGWCMIRRPPLSPPYKGGGLEAIPHLSKGGLGGVAVAILLEMSLHGLADVPYFKNDLALLTWIVLAVLIVASRQETKPV